MSAENVEMIPNDVDHAPIFFKWHIFVAKGFEKASSPLHSKCKWQLQDWETKQGKRLELRIFRFELSLVCYSK